METEQTPNRRASARKHSYSRFGLVSCVVAIGFMLALFAVILLAFYRSPYYQGVDACRTNLKNLGAAVERYSIKNAEFPDELPDIVPDYISATALRCPNLDASVPGAVTYTYVKPDINVPDGTPMLTCEHHRLRPPRPPTTVQYRTGGDVVLVGPRGEVRR